MGDTKPLPCPFCGEEAISFSEDFGWDHQGQNVYRAYAGCGSEECGIGFEILHAGDDLFDKDIDDTEDGIRCHALEEQAIALWNRRYDGHAAND